MTTGVGSTTVLAGAAAGVGLTTGVGSGMEAQFAVAWHHNSKQTISSTTTSEAKTLVPGSWRSTNAWNAGKLGCCCIALNLVFNSTLSILLSRASVGSRRAGSVVNLTNSSTTFSAWPLKSTMLGGVGLTTAAAGSTSMGVGLAGGVGVGLTAGVG